jgi:hypothetical protein
MDNRFKYLPSPQLWGIYKELKDQPYAPENSQADRQLLTQPGVHQVTCIEYA